MHAPNFTSRTYLAAALVVGAFGIGTIAAGAETRPFTDAAGRQVEIPAVVHRVFAAGVPAAVLLYVMAPEAMLGWPGELAPDAKAMLPASYAQLPVVGRLTGRHATAKPESVAALHPDLILDVGTVDAHYAALADQVQKSSGVPYVLIDGKLEHSAATFRLLGPVLGQTARAELLARAAETLITAAQAARDGMKTRRRIYYARGGDGLETAPPGSIVAEIMALAGGVNVAEDVGGAGLATVPLERVISWSPDLVLVSSAALYQLIAGDAHWHDVQAVAEHRLYLAPSAPFGWLEEPPGVNRLAGLPWLAGILADGAPPARIKDIARDFYRLFYHVELDEAQLARLLASPQP